MREPVRTRGWSHHFLYRTTHLRTTWKLRLGLLALLVGIPWLTSGWWTIALARSLVCESDAAPSDAILIENFDPDYLLFERAAELRRKGLAPRVLVPVREDPSSAPNLVGLGTAKVMAEVAHLDAMDVVPYREVEPISLNAAYDVVKFLRQQQLRSVIIVAPNFRSKRSSLIYAATLGQAGIAVTCEPVGAVIGIDSWTASLHGIQNVVEQWAKLQYYRLYVLPFRRAPAP
jgi:hypothetical protein